jgi:hypothetical protein
MTEMNNKAASLSVNSRSSSSSGSSVEGIMFPSASDIDDATAAVMDSPSGLLEATLSAVPETEIDTQSPMFSTSASSSVSSIDPVDGECFQLLNSVEEDSAPLTQKVVAALKRELSLKDLTEAAWYGHPLSVADAQKLLPPGDGGLIWHVTIIPDAYFVNGKLTRGLNPRDFHAENSSIKPRRPSLPLTATEFFSSLTKIDGPAKGQARYIFYGVLNGWPGLRTMQLVSLEQHRRHSSALPSPRELISGQILWVKAWSEEEEGMRGVDPKIFMGSHKIYRAKLRGAPWSGSGWSRESPGFCFWYESQRAEGPRISYGTNMLTEIESEPICTKVHMISHRYAVPRGESPRDRLTYHSICLLEWDHGRYCTVIEAAYLNGMGGYKGKCNWFDDRDEPVTSLYQALPPALICPWRSSQSEIRCYDVPAKDFQEFRDYIAKYEGSTKRFVDPRFTFSHAARLTFRSKPQIAQYMINYIMRDSTYAELKRNCQTFTADLCSFLAGKKGVAPFHPVNRIEYQNRTYLFLYNSEMYDKKKGNKK